MSLFFSIVLALMIGWKTVAFALDAGDLKIDGTDTNSVYQANGDSGAPKRDAHVPKKSKKKPAKKSKKPVKPSESGQEHQSE